MGWNPFKEAEKAAKKVISKAVGSIEDIADDVKHAFESSLEDIKNTAHQEFKQIRLDTNNSIRYVTRDAKKVVSEIKEHVIDEIEDAAEEAIDKVKDAIKVLDKAGVPDVLLKTALPTAISISAEIIGNGVEAKYADSEEGVEQVMDMIRSGDLNADIMYHVVPDEITVKVGVELALVVSVDVGASITYNSQEDIKLIVQWFKDNT